MAARGAAGVLAAEAFMIVHHPQWQRVRQLLADGAVGRLWRIDGAFSFNDRDAGNIRNQAELGGGGLRQFHLHPHASAPGNELPWRPGGAAADCALQCPRVR